MYDTLDTVRGILARWDHHVQEFKAINAPHEYRAPPPGAYPYSHSYNPEDDGQGAIASLLRLLMPSWLPGSRKKGKGGTKKTDPTSALGRSVPSPHAQDGGPSCQAQYVRNRARGNTATNGKHCAPGQKPLIMMHQHQQQLAMDMETTVASYNCWMWSLFAAFFFLLIITLASSSAGWASDDSWYHYDSHHHDGHHAAADGHSPTHPVRSGSFLYYPYGWNPGQSEGSGGYLETAAFVLICISLLALVGCAVYLALCRGYASVDSQSSSATRRKDAQDDGSDACPSSMCSCCYPAAMCMSSYLCCCCYNCGNSDQQQDEDGVSGHPEGYQPQQLASARGPLVVFVRELAETNNPQNQRQQQQQQNRMPPYAP
jgi:hypothetical protein